MRRVVVWGTGNMGVDGDPVHGGVSRAGTGRRDHVVAGQGWHATPPSFAGLDAETGVLATTDVDAALADCDAVAYMASGDIRPDDAVADIERCLRAGAHVVTPSLYSLYDPRSAPQEWVDRLTAAAEEGGATPAGQRRRPGLGQRRARRHGRRAVHAHQDHPLPGDLRLLDLRPAARRHGVSCGFGGSMDEIPMMLLPSIPTMVWGGNIRLIGRGLGLEIDDITEDRRTAAARGDGRERHGPLREGHAGRVLAQDHRLVRRQAAHRHRPHHPHRPGVRPGLAAARRGGRATTA